MAYCRWSSDDFQCDVYCWEDVCDYWRIEVADYRLVFDEPLPPLVDPIRDPEGWIRRCAKVQEMMRHAKRERIGGPHDGSGFAEPGPGSAADRLESLRAAGYNVPQGAIDALREEQEQLAAQEVSP